MNGSILLSLLSGGIAALCTAIVFLVLMLPMRIFGLFSIHSMVLAGWSMALGLMAGSFCAFDLFSLPLCLPFGCLALLCGGMVVGFLASSLSEILELIPALADRFALSASFTPLCWALCLGKTLGALLASLSFLS